MREPHKFPRVLSGVMIFLLSKFVQTRRQIILNTLFKSSLAVLAHCPILPLDLISILSSLRIWTRRHALRKPYSSSIRSRSCFPCRSSCSLPCGSWKMGCLLEVGSRIGMSSGRRIRSGFLLSWAPRYSAGLERRILISLSRS